MTFIRSFVTIGAHHHGPHVDALYALAERCGAEVIVIDTQGEEDVAHLLPPPAPPVRVAYAGFDPDDLRVQSWKFEASR